MLVTGYGMLTGKWQNNILKEKYLELYKNMDSFGHPTGTEAVKKFNQDAIFKKKLEDNSEVEPKEINPLNNNN